MFPFFCVAVPVHKTLVALNSWKKGNKYISGSTVITFHLGKSKRQLDLEPAYRSLNKDMVITFGP
jgi:hypothetical protein